MLLPADQRRQLGAFLRARREALSPDAVGLAPAGRRRTPGLRREEVAQLSGVSTAWYSWAAQGRDIALSETALARLAGALRLTAAERAYLFDLTRRRDPAAGATANGDAEEVVALVNAIAAPAYVLDRFWNASCWNAPARRLFSIWLASGEQNLLRFVFLDPAARRFIQDWDERARRIVAEFRADTAAEPDHPALLDLLRDLRAGSPDFGQLWTDHAVLAREGGLRLFDHPDDGLVSYRQFTLVPATHPGHKLVVLVPLPPGEAAGLPRMPDP